MNLVLFFRLILMSIFQRMVVSSMKSYKGDMSYDNTFFYCPRVVAKDGFAVSLQIHNGNYCSSNNGYRTLGDTMQSVEFGFPSMNEPLMFKYSEEWGYSKQYDENDEELPFDELSFDVTKTVGNIPVDVMEQVFEKHGGIDWEATLSVDVFNKMINGK